MNNWQDNDKEKGIFDGGDFGDIVRLQMKEGEYSIRILGAYKLYRYHWINKVNRSVNCSEGCELCANGEKGSLRYVVNVVDRADNVVKLWEFGRRVKTSIMNIANKYGDPSGYDLVVIRKGLELEDTVYTIFPSRDNDRPLSEEEKKLKTYDLDKLYGVTPKEIVQSYLNGVIPQRDRDKTVTKPRPEDTKVAEKLATKPEEKISPTVQKPPVTTGGTDDLPVLS